MVHTAGYYYTFPLAHWPHAASALPWSNVSELSKQMAQGGGIECSSRFPHPKASNYSLILAGGLNIQNGHRWTPQGALNTADLILLEVKKAQEKVVNKVDSGLLSLVRGQSSECCAVDSHFISRGSLKSKHTKLICLDVFLSGQTRRGKT